MGVAAADDPRVGARHPLGDRRWVEVLVEALRLRAGRRMGHEHEVVADADAALGRQAAQPREVLVLERVVRPLGGGA